MGSSARLRTSSAISPTGLFRSRHTRFTSGTVLLPLLRPWTGNVSAGLSTISLLDLTVRKRSGEEAHAAPREARAENRGLRRELPTPASIHVTSTGRLKQGTRWAS